MCTILETRDQSVLGFRYSESLQPRVLGGHIVKDTAESKVTGGAHIIPVKYSH